RRRHTRFSRDWSSDVCSSDLLPATAPVLDRVTATDSIDVLAAAAKDLSNAIRQDENARKAEDLELVLSKLQSEIDRVRMNHAQQIGRAACRARAEKREVG